MCFFHMDVPHISKLFRQDEEIRLLRPYTFVRTWYTGFNGNLEDYYSRMKPATQLTLHPALWIRVM